jgi:hypothetical protein
MFNLETLQHRNIPNARYLFTQGISGKHYFCSDYDKELLSLSKEGAFSKDEKPQTVFSFRDQFDFRLENADFKLSKDESKLKMITEHYDANIIVEYLMTETTPGEGFTKIY